MKNIFLNLLWSYTVTAFPGSSEGKESVYNAGDLGLIPGFGLIPLEKGMAIHSSILA